MARKPTPAQIKARRSRVKTLPKKPPSILDITGAPPVLSGVKTRPGQTRSDNDPFATPGMKGLSAFGTAEAWRRQNLLHQAGYAVKRDGVWGSRTQVAWEDYLRKRRSNPLSLGQGPLKPTTDRDNAVLETVRGGARNTPITPEQVEAKRVADRRVAEAVAKRQRAEARAAILDNAKRIRTYPSSASELTLRQFTDVIVDPETKFNLYSPVGRRAAFSWLDSHGYRPRDNSPKEIHRLLETALQKQEQAHESRNVKLVRDNVIRRLGLQPGSKPSWWTFNESVPNAERLAKLIFSPNQGDRWHGSRMLQSLLNHGLTGEAVWDNVKQVELLRAARSLQPFGASRLADLTGDPQSVSVLSILQDIYGIQDLYPMPDLSGATPGFDKDRQQWVDAAMEKRRTNPETVEKNAKALGKLHGTVAALLRSDNEADFKKKLASFLAVEEQKFVRFQQEYAATRVSFWGRAIEKVLAPGDFLRTAMVYDAMLGAQYVDRARSWARGEDQPGQRNVDWSDAKVILGADPDDLPYYDGLAEEAHGALRLTFELTSDPLNVAHPFRSISSGWKFLSKGSSLGTYRLAGGIADAEKLAARASRNPVTKILAYDALVTYEKGTWSKLGWLPDKARVAMEEKKKHRAFARSLLLTRDEAIAGAQERVTEMQRHGFTKVAGRPQPEIRAPKSAKTKGMLDAAIPRAQSLIVTHRDFEGLVQEALNSAQSVYLKRDRTGPYSNFGASVVANLAEKARVGAGHHLGVERGWGVYRAHTEEHAELLDLAARIRDGADDLPPMTDAKVTEVLEDAAAIETAGEKLAYQEYLSTLQGIGLYLQGGAIDPALMKEALRRTYARMDDIEAVILPNLQNAIEQHHDSIFEALRKAPAGDGAAVKAEHALWDEGDLWRGRTGKDARMLRELGRESFDRPVPVKNWQHELGEVAWDEASELIEAEIRRRVPRVLAYGARELVGGTSTPGFDAEDIVAALKKEVYDAWEINPETRQWYDTRETILASDLYARNQIPIADSAEGWFKRGRDEALYDPIDNVLAGLAESPRFAANGPLDASLWRFSWALGSRYKKLPGGWDTIRRDSPDQILTAKARGNRDWKGLKDDIAEAHQQDANLRAAIEGQKLALHRAYTEALPKELARDGALMRAWAEAESNFLKFSYRSLMGIVNTWVFATLPLRPGWMVRNVIDNTVKLLVQGVYDPRYYFLGGKAPGSAVGSVFDMGLNEIRPMIQFLDLLNGGDGQVVNHWDNIVSTVWEHSSDTLKRIFKAHAVPVNEKLIEGSALDPYIAGRLARSGAPSYNPDIIAEDAAARGDDELLALATRDRAKNLLRDKAAEEGDGWYAKFRHDVWELFAQRPENYFRRVLYRHEFDRVHRELLVSGLADDVSTAKMAHDRAWLKVEETLFDYSKITIAEDNFRLFFPFIQFWRKNTTFWAKQFVQKPWLPMTVLKLDQARREAHADLPQWMQRYLHVDEITDAAAYIPGLDKIVSALIPDDTMYDPANLLSFSPFYRTFKAQVYGETQNLPSDKPGWSLIAPMIDALNDYGLGMSPFVRKPLESVGIANSRAWQTVFPQTGLVTALTRQFISEEIGNDVADWERIFTLMLGDKPSDQIADQMDYYVQAEVAGQVARGETPDPTRARRIIKGWFLTQNAWGYFTGMYLRRATPEDVYLAKLMDESILGESKLSPKEKDLVKLWSQRGMDRLTWERYITIRPVIEQYYQAPGWEEKQQIKQENPDISRWVDSVYRGDPYSGKWLKYAQRTTDTERFGMALQIIESVDPPFDVRDAALGIFKDAKLEAYWKRNDSPQQVKDRMAKAAAFEYYADLNKAYFSIPGTDNEAQSGFLDAHPELIRHWNRNNDPEDDFEAIIGSSNAAARSAYFAVVKKSGWDAAAPLLKAMPFMFEDTKAAGKIDEATGTWKRTGGGGNNWSPERHAAWIKAKPHLKWFFENYMKKVGEKKAWAWLESTDSPVAQIVKDYLKKYAKHSRKSVDFLRAKPWLKLFYDMPPAEREKWLKSDAEGAAIVRDYFKKYAKSGFTQHARDYLKVQGLLKSYFAMGKDERREWLNGGSADAEKVLAFFKKYGKAHQWERAWRKANPQLVDGTPEQKRRLDFWNQYYALTPDQRPAFVLEHAEDYGVFLYGDFGDEERYDQKQEWLRRATGLKMSQRQKDYLYVKPLLDFFSDLPDEEKALFLRLNPELGEYLDKWADHKNTGNKVLDAKIEQYFKLPAHSAERSQFLRDNPTVQDYFDSNSTPAEAALRNVLEQYFALPYGPERSDFVLQHPEVAVYFDERQAERQALGDQYNAFDQADPRLAPYIEDAQDLVRSAEGIRERARKLAMDALAVEDISSRRDRSTSRTR